MQNGAVVQATGSGGIALNGTGSNGAFSNQGVYLIDAGTAVRTLNGALLITGTGGSGGDSSVGVNLDMGAVVDSTGGAITLADLKNLAKTQGMQSMLEDGLKKVERGITTIEEIFRVLSE